MLRNPEKHVFDGNETIIVVQTSDGLKEVLMPRCKTFDLAVFALCDSPCICISVRWWLKKGCFGKGQKCIFERLESPIHQIINHTDRAEVNRMEWKDGTKCFCPRGLLFQSVSAFLFFALYPSFHSVLSLYPLSLYLLLKAFNTSYSKQMLKIKKIEKTQNLDCYSSLFP